MHLNDNVLRALIDPELAQPQPSAEWAAAREHLAACPDCRARRDARAARAARVQSRLTALDPSPDELPHPATWAMTQLASRQSAASAKEGMRMFKRILAPRVRPLWIGLALVVLASAAFSFEPVRVWAGDVLALFRVKRITVVSVDASRLSELVGGSNFGKQIGQLLSDSVKVTREPLQPQAVANAAEASKKAGFAVRLPTSRSDAPYLTVEGGTAFQFAVNRMRAQTLLDQAGGKGMQLPASIDGALVKIEIPIGASAGYGDCPKLADENAKGSAGRRMANCVLLAEMPSPSVDVPPGVDLAQLAEMGLQLTGMNTEQARAFSRTIDWKTTLVVPIPRNAASYKSLTVDGVPGYLIQRPADDVPQYALIWVKDGIIYVIGGVGSDTSAALSMANSLR